MSHKCQDCNAFKWKEEAPSMCCSAGKVQLSPLEPLSEPLYSLIMGSHPEQVHFMDHVWKYNGGFNMISFRAKQVLQNGFMLSFKGHGQVYHLVVSLLPAPQQEAKFLKIYFMGEDKKGSAHEVQQLSGCQTGIGQTTAENAT